MSPARVVSVPEQPLVEGDKPVPDGKVGIERRTALMPDGLVHTIRTAAPDATGAGSVAQYPHTAQFAVKMVAYAARPREAHGAFIGVVHDLLHRSAPSSSFVGVAHRPRVHGVQPLDTSIPTGRAEGSHDSGQLAYEWLVGLRIHGHSTHQP